MGFKSKARRARKDAGEDTGRKRRSKDLDEGEKSCAIKDCKNWADKSHGGRSIAFDNLADVWDEGELVGEGRRLAICKPCYRHYKKEKKDDESQTW
ncbi:MAG: hypothetical protein CND85_01675 [Marine Group II euryarchaeote MED-G33]|nr:MAG: hypothetical protein CND85_01675 [Marine Group II euryarchaeote MED-G33]